MSLSKMRFLVLYDNYSGPPRTSLWCSPGSRGWSVRERPCGVLVLRYRPGHYVITPLDYLLVSVCLPSVGQENEDNV